MNKPILNLYNLIFSSEGTKLAKGIADFLEIISISEAETEESPRVFLPSSDQLLQEVVKVSLDSKSLASNLNAYFVDELTEALKSSCKADYRYALDRLLQVEKVLDPDDPTKDDCKIKFMQFDATGTNLDSLLELDEAIRNFCKKYDNSDISSNVTFSFIVQDELINDLLNLADNYIQIINDPNLGGEQPLFYLFRIGDLLSNTYKFWGSNLKFEINHVLAKYIKDYDLVKIQEPDFLMLYVLRE